MYKIMLSHLDNDDNSNKNNKYSRFNNDVMLSRRNKSVVPSIRLKNYVCSTVRSYGRKQDLSRKTYK